LVAVFVKLTVASGTTAPAGSVTAPKTSAESEVCAHDGAADRNITIKTNPSVSFENFILPPTTESVDERGTELRRRQRRRQKSEQGHELR
jgi:hypothetical protein